MGSIFKRENGTWYYQWRENGKQLRRTLKTDDKQIAKKRAAMLELKLMQGSYGLNTYKTTVEQCLIRFLEHKKPVIKESTYKRYFDIARLLGGYFADTPARTLNTERVTEYIAFRRKTVSGKTIHEEVNVLKGALKHAWGDRLLDELPVRIWPTIKKIPARPERLGFYSLGDIAKLKEYFRGHRFEPAFLFALYTGCRRSEVAAIKVSDVDLTTMTLRIRNIKTESNSFDSFRYISINQNLIPVITKQISVVKSGLLFPWFASLPKNEPSKILLKACKEIDVPYKRFHGLRHTMATFLIASGVNVRNVMAIMGWTELSTAERYTHLAEALNNRMNLIPF